MSASRLITFAVGVVLIVIGLMLLVASPTTIMPNLVIGLILIVVGIAIMSGKIITL